MDIDLPLILFLAVALTGIGWLLDWQLNGAKRKRALAGLKPSSLTWIRHKTADEGYLAAHAAAKAQPVWAEYSQSFFRYWR